MIDRGAFNLEVASYLKRRENEPYSVLPKLSLRQPLPDKAIIDTNREEIMDVLRLNCSSLRIEMDWLMVEGGIGCLGASGIFVVLIDKMVALVTLMINLVLSSFLLRQASKDKHYERTICHI